MKHTPTLFLCALLCLNATAQTRTLDDYYKQGTSWCEYVWERQSHNPAPSEWMRFSIGKDSTINTKTYHLVLKQNTGIIGGVRTENEKVYYLNIGNLNEMLMYDFDLQVGDVLAWKPEINTVTSVSQVQLSDGSFVERYNLNQNGQSEFWLRGIGSNYGFLSSYLSPHNPAYGFIYSAEHYNNPTGFSYNFYGYFADQCFPTAINNVEEISQPVIYPNPASDRLTIKMPWGSYQVEIMNTLGILVYQSNIEASLSTIDISVLPCGTYTLHIRNKDNRYIEKLVILH